MVWREETLPADTSRTVLPASFTDIIVYPKPYRRTRCQASGMLQQCFGRCPTTNEALPPRDSIDLVMAMVSQVRHCS